MYAKALKDKTMELRKAKAPLATFLVSVSSKAKDLAKSEDPKAETFNDEPRTSCHQQLYQGC